jgi:hypothetical protein
MIIVVYVLCALTSLACAILLWRGWRRSRARLLYWSAICFAGLCLNNVLLIADTRIFPEFDLALVRMLPSLLGALALVYGLIFEVE